jgi:hypothetical protein
VRRLAVLLGSFLVALGVLAAPAFATFHLNMVNEVMLASSTGDPGVQFVEFLDHGGTEEAFTPVFGPYKLVVYDAAGNKLGEQMLDPTGLRGAASADREYLLSTAAADAAFGVTGDEHLSVGLPAAAGQACFEANASPSAFSCLTWGTITKQIPINSQGTGTVHGPVPPNGQSDQRLQDGSVVVAPPTPKARNKAAPSGGGFAGVGLGKHTAKVDKSHSAHVRLKCPAGSGGCSGRVTLRALGKTAKKLGRASFSLAAGQRMDVLVGLNSSGRKRLAAASKHKLKVNAVTVAHDGAGQRKTTTGKVTLVG